ncbi:anti-sigma F factor antagonist [Clostridium chauvoei]|uniref:Anti-sigma F factor antagonist n=2 Tax=Clostridium chauvoei TaxID=46867 RepID=S6EYD3_9CLOT|nr:anti-sigma F factor antagonist [Clostridium chauvoei]ATD54675.1 anti-sigma F factor antagonist [Clostridium chauvoei]ATD57643.1 anti-sigma F factor antagonist [Clostridium chauvoei]MBX7279971.1 anti-sigma F factor antagonist [Clostridium chauvoei]MBX7282370.1 anti-sigma F factor antagonist [Clostridium chauvoei]MBX7284862.1 anti-sigma F factor antagonist [Clostridium chauvoei]
MYLKFDKNTDKLIISLIGELDHHSAEEVRVKIDDRIDRDNIKKVILNFNGVTFMDSSGIGVVIGRLKKMQNRNGKLCVADVNRTVNRVFEISGMYKIIDSYNSIDEAIKSI